MKSKEKYAIVMVGKTHSGKTTFAKKLAKNLAGFEVLEADPIAVFLKEHFPVLKNIDVQKSGKWQTPSLKFLMFRTMLEYTLGNNIGVILCNSNLSTFVRSDLIKILKKHSYKTIGVFLNYSEEIINQRVLKSQRDTSVLGSSKSFDELVVTQRSRLENPQSNEFHHFFEITDPAGLTHIESKIIGLIL